MNTKAKNETRETNVKGEVMIDVVSLGTKILGNPTQVNMIKKNLEDNDSFILGANKFLKAYPELEVIGDTPLLKFISTDDGSPMVFSLGVYQGDKNDVVVVNGDRDANINPDFVCVGYGVGIDKYSLIQHKESGLILKGAIAYSKDFKQPSKSEEIQGQPEAQDLRPRPIPETPLRKLSDGTKFKVVSSLYESSHDHDTPLVDIEILGTGERFNRVITNGDLRRFIASGENELQITGRKEMKSEQKNIMGKVIGETVSTKVYLTSLKPLEVDLTL